MKEDRMKDYESLDHLSDPTNKTHFWQSCTWYNEMSIPLSLLPSVCIIVLLSCVERRRKLYDWERRIPCLSGRMGFIVPLDFTGKMQNRWSYAFAFGAVTPFALNLIIVSKTHLNLPPYLKMLEVLIMLLIVSITCMPLFACLSTPQRLLGGVLGLLFSFSWFILQLWFFISCSVPAFDSTDYSEDEPWDNRRVLVYQVPQILCLGFLVCRFGSIIVKGVQKRLRNHTQEDEVKKHEYKHVQCLLTKPAERSVQKSWFQRKVYEWDPYFKFPNRIIATVVLSVYGVYMILTIEQIIFWWLSAFVEAFALRMSFNIHLNYILCSWYISAACATISSFFHISQVLLSYRKHMKLLRAGKKLFLPKKYKLNPAQGVMGLLKYPGYQIAFSLWGYVIVHMAMFMIVLMFVYLVILPIQENSFLEWLSWMAISLSNIFILLALMGLQRLLGHFFFMQDKQSENDEVKPLALNNRKAFHNFNYFFFFINMMMGMMSCVLRIIKSAVVGLMLVSRIERTIMPEGFESLDLSYCMWVGMIMADHYHTNPVLVCFCHLLLKHTSKSLRDGQYTRLNSEHQVKDRVHIRWHVVYTLLRNPKLILLRKKHKQANDKEAELAYAWAITNTVRKTAHGSAENFGNPAGTFGNPAGNFGNPAGTFGNPAET
ncbi:stimulated by retinoic acid gene 6 protein-like [Silurus meridionalis]|uniref:Stimulated by retinoic acid gene 6 protein-like n=1 Tax=Silurus meridionalis TaxID=175797 RepID=A0A8T0A6H4_SILME|nr:stimulated by retinoic acid gene 6 protein-like [Silurus meridionalis]KAF7686646.1 hypothetical protein HF521_015039 [Silurus meridionalis]